MDNWGPKEYKDLQIGDKFVLQERAIDLDYECQSKKTIDKEYEIVGIYKHHVLAVTKNGLRKSVPKGTLIQNKIIVQESSYESLKAELNHKEKKDEH